MGKLTHLDSDGNARMVDVGDKDITRRRASASGKVSMSRETVEAIKAGTLKKGDVLAVARVAGIQTAKRTSDIIPLTHPLPLDHVSVDFEIGDDHVLVRAEASVTSRTGVEMEALSAVAGAALCIYDMAKAMDRGMVISDIRLEEKEGGRSGHWRRQ